MKESNVKKTVNKIQSWNMYSLQIKLNLYNSTLPRVQHNKARPNATYHPQPLLKEGRGTLGQQIRAI